MHCNYGSEGALYIAVAAAVISTATTMYAQSEQADATTEYQKKAQQTRDKEIADNYALSLASMEHQQEGLQQRIRQEQEATVTEEERNARAAASARATARTAAGEAGVAGLSVEALLNDFTAQEGRYRYGVRRNNELVTDQLTAEMEGARAQAQGRIHSITSLNLEPVSRPTYLGAALRIGGDALGAYAKYSRPSTTNPTPSRRYMPVDSDW